MPVLAFTAGGVAHAQTQPPVVMVAPPPRPATPRDHTKPIITLSCKLADERFRPIPVTFTIIGARARYAIYERRRKVIVEGRPTYRISSTDRRFQGWRHVENIYGASGIAFNGPDHLIATAQLDEPMFERYREGVLSLFVSENLAAKRLVRYTGFCAATMKPQDPDPDQIID